jgi:hypothetical protein
MSDDLLALLYASLFLGAVLVASFILWFRFRDRPVWDKVLFGLATAMMAILIGARYSFKGSGQAVISIPMIPSLLVYLWFAGLWGTRRERAAIYQWGIRHGVHITSLDRTYELGPGGRRLVAEYRIVARRVSDGKILTGRVLTGRRTTSRQGFDVFWEGEVPPQHLHRPPGEGGP